MKNSIQSAKVSVIVPNYNHSKYLKERIESVLNQSYQDIEVFLLDDCSTDDSRDILLSYKGDERVSAVVFNDRNSGSPFIQWEKGIQMATGDFVWIAESDDYADPEFLAHCMEAFEKYPEAKIVYTGSTMVDANSEAIPSMEWDKFSINGTTYTHFNTESFLRKHLMWENEIYNASMVLFKKECFNVIGTTQYRSFRYCGDWLVWANIIRQGDVVRCNKKLNYFRQHTQRVSPSAEKEGLYFTEGIEVIK